MRRAFVACCVALALAGTGSAARQAGQVREVSMPGKVFVPRTMQALVGDTVAWRNGDSSTHTVTANDDSFDSGFIDAGGMFAHTFAKPGSYAYHCTIHKFMRGVVVVVPVALSAPARPLSSGGRAVLQGLAPTGTQEVIVQQLGDRPQVVGRVSPAADGSFTLALRVVVPTAYRALVGGIASPTVHVAVAPLVAVQPGAGRLVAEVRPARAGARAVLQRYVLERFAWRTVGRAVVDRNSHVSLPLPADRAGRFRVVVRGDGGWADGASTAVVLAGS
jgi:plastocyanin